MIQIRECPMCHPIKDKQDNMWKLGLSNYDWYNCFRCGSKGNWEQLQRIFQIQGYDYEVYSRGLSFMENRDYINWQELSNGYENEEIYSSEITSHTITLHPSYIRGKTEQLLKEKPLLARILNQRKLSAETLEFYKTGIDIRWIPTRNHESKKKELCLSFPMYKFDELQQIYIASKEKIRSFYNKAFMTQYPMSSESGLFGLSEKNCHSETEDIILTEGEYDCMSVYESCGKMAMSVPNGANGDLSESIMEYVLKYKRVLLWMDFDEAGERAAAKLKNKIEERNENMVVVIVDKKGICKALGIDESKVEGKDANDILKTETGKQIIADYLDKWLCK